MPGAARKIPCRRIRTVAQVGSVRREYAPHGTPGLGEPCRLEAPATAGPRPGRLHLACYSQGPDGADHTGRRPVLRVATAGRRSMNRFLKSAAFPILVVILLAYFAQQLILNKGDSAQSVG